MDSLKKAGLECEMDNVQIIVIDNGTHKIKVGYSGQNQPRMCVDSIYGKVKAQNQQDSISNEPYYLVGQKLKDCIKENKLEITLNKIMDKAHVKDDCWPQMQQLWQTIIEEFQETNENNVVELMMIDSVHVSKEYRQRIAEILFEQMKITSIIFMNSSTLSLFSSGETTQLFQIRGFVVDSGHGITTVCPIYEVLILFKGYPQYYSMLYSSISGSEVNKYILEVFSQQQQLKILYPEINLSENSIETDNLITNIKHSCCEVAMNYDEAVENFKNIPDEDKTFQLLDGTDIKINVNIKYTACELFFQPQLVGLQDKNIIEMIKESYSSCDEELKIDCQNSFIISGGNSVIKGFIDRVKYEIQKTYPEIYENFKFVFDVYRQNAAWVGGSMISSITEFQHMAITRTEYLESGDQKKNIINKRTF